MKELVKIKKKYFKNLKKDFINIGDLVLITQFKGNFRYIFLGILIKKSIKLFNYKISLLNLLKKEVILKEFNLYSNSIKSIFKLKKIKKLKRNNLNYLKIKGLKTYKN